MSLNLKFLETFAVVAELASMSDAARRLKTAQPAISRQMRLLEEQLGTPLLDRDHSGIRLTVAGQQLYDTVAPWLRELDSLAATLAGETDGGLIRLGSLTEIGQTTIMSALLRFREGRPNVHLKVEYAKGFELVAALESGQLDAIIVAGEVQRSGIIARPILTERSVVVTRAGNRDDVNDARSVRSKPFVAYREDDPLLQAYLKRHYPTTKIDQIGRAIIVNSHRSMIDALLSFDGYSVMPWQSVADHISAHSLRIASSKELKGQLYFAYRRSWGDTRLGHLLIDHLQVQP